MSTLPAGPVSVPTVGNLATALAAAQQKVRAVAHDAINAFHKYHYTSSEAIIEAAKTALAGSGLAVAPLEESMSDGGDCLHCRFLLLHTSGESLPLVRDWPIVPDRGRPLDKATASASTLALSYLLRDLLLMPRVNGEDEVSARDDRPQQSKPPVKPPAKEKTPPPHVPQINGGCGLPLNGRELVRRLRDHDERLAKDGTCRPGELLSAIDGWGRDEGLGEDVSKWNPDVYGAVAAFVAKWQAQMKEDNPF